MIIVILEKLSEKVEMTEEETKLFKEILNLVRQKEEGMFESVIGDIDRKINEVINNDN